ncbi:hypothetical protein IX321_000330 [Bacteroides pyogenes]|nr:hypothetical protein [Bacteroides pyogenes]MBR8745927.1 hypothetical protein [Bacteroides pyogenes]MBR8756203.1 hypothetical protein [Bacteroides pyogenes]
MDVFRTPCKDSFFYTIRNPETCLIFAFHQDSGLSGMIAYCLPVAGSGAGDFLSYAVCIVRYSLPPCFACPVAIMSGESFILDLRLRA